MNSGRDPGDLRESMPREGQRAGLARARWVRATAALSLAVAVTAVSVPHVVSHAADGAVDAKSARGARPSETTVSARTGDVYWLQVGAFRDPEAAARVAQRLREQKYPVHESMISRQPNATAKAPVSAQPERDRYEVVVTGASLSEVEGKLAAKGLTSRAAAEGAVITPGLPLGEAVALSKDLAGDGLAVRVRRMDTAVPAAPRTENGAAPEALHRVRVGGFTDRAAAETALKDLRGRGYQAVLTRGSE